MTDVSRRALLAQAASGLLVAGGLGCGRVTPLRPNRTAYPIAINGSSPPPDDLVRLLAERAREARMNPTVTLVPAQGLVDELRRTTRLGQYDPAERRTPPVNGVVVTGVLDPVALARDARAAIERGVHLVSYPVALVPGAVALRTDPAAGARLLVDAVVGERRPAGTALLVLPPPAHVAVNPFAAQGPALQAALGGALAARAPGLTVLATTAARAPEAEDAVRRALADRPDLRLVAVWDDAAALGAVAAVRGASARCAVAALGAPAVTSRASIAELQRGGILRAVVAVRARDLARALVDVPRALLAGSAAHDVVLAPQLLLPGGPVLRAYAADYARHPPATAFDHVPLNPTLPPPG